MTLVEQYEQLHNTITERAIYINDMLARMFKEVPKEHISYLPQYCGEFPDEVKMEVSLASIFITHVDVDNYTTIWTIDAAYIEMSDEDVKAHYKRKMQSLYDKDKQRILCNLENDAKMFGYKLVKEG